MNATWECIVVGGGAAGLSAALVLGRARRRTLLVDAGAPSNRFSHGIGGLLGHDTKPPARFYAEARENVAAYPAVERRSGEVAAAERDGNGFTLTLADGTRETTRTVILATGMDYERPDVPGLDPLWGGSVFHCPFCHGWEHAGRPLGVLDRGDTGVHRASLLRAWSDDVTLLTNGPDELDDGQRAELRERGIVVDPRPVAGLEASAVSPDAADADDTASEHAPALSAVRFTGGETRPLGGLLIPVTLRQRGPLATQLGLELLPETPLSTESIQVDPMGATSVPGVFSAGDASISMPSVANAIAAGSAAAAGVVQRLVVAH